MRLPKRLVNSPVAAKACAMVVSDVPLLSRLSQNSKPGVSGARCKVASYMRSTLAALPAGSKLSTPSVKRACSTLRRVSVPPSGPKAMRLATLPGSDTTLTA